jgi:formylglycine-generating enzyme required for sulfatase activity
MNIRILLSIIGVSAAIIYGQQLLHVDSVTVDSVWNSDSTGRTSRDCNLRFIPAGLGTARCTLAVTFNGGTNWYRVRDSVTILSPSSNIYTCGQKATVHIRFNGGDRQNIAFKVTARQNKPDQTISPSAIFMGSVVAAPASGLDTTITPRLTITTLVNRGVSPIQKVYWDKNGDGIYADSTDSLFTQWTSATSTGTAGQKSLLIAKVRDANGMFSTPETLLVQFGLRKLIQMAPITSGSFTMGNDAGLDNEKPAHTVSITSFSMQKTEITTECFMLLSGLNPLSSRDSALAPARNMTWYAAVLFCNTLSKRLGLDTCYTYTSVLPNGAIDNTLACNFSKPGYRLPTEAEWEYACRAGSTTTYFWGNTVDTAYVWAQSNSGGVAQPVGTRQPSAWGLYDMSGNVSEWVNDAYVPYTAGTQSDPTGATVGSYHTQRGGSAATSGVLGENVSSVCRDNGDPTLAYYYNGFRVAKRP